MRCVAVLRASLALLALVVASRAHAAAPLSAHMVRDIDTRFITGFAEPHSFTAGPDRVYFIATTPETGTELYSVDGSLDNGGLRLEADLVPGTGSSNPQRSQIWAGTHTLYFVTAIADRATDMQLFALDTTTRETTELPGIPFWSPNAALPYAVVAGDRFFFIAVSEHASLWTSDGTQAGTISLQSALGPDRYLKFDTLVAHGNALYFIAESATEAELWTSDGTLAGTHEIAVLGATLGYVDCAIDYDGAYWIQIQQGILRHAYGSTTIETLRNDLPMSNMSECNIAGMGGAVYFVVTPLGAPVDPEELWRSGPAVGDTAMVTLLAPEDDDTTSSLTAIGEHLVFWRNVLWRSDGTAQGTAHVVASGSTLQPSYNPPTKFRAAGNELVFWARTDDGAMWATDGTDAGTHRIDVPVPIYTDDAAVLDGRVYGESFDTSPHTHAEVWSTDATAAGTQPTATIWPSTYGSLGALRYHASSAADGTDLLFLALGEDDPNEGPWMLWRSDGTRAGTNMLPGSAYTGEQIDTFAAGGEHRTILRTTYQGAGIFVVDPAFQSAVRVDDDPRAGSLYSYRSSTGPNVIYSCDAGGPYDALCGLDATLAARTVLAPDIQFGQLFTAGSVAGEHLFFAQTSASPTEWLLWRTDGTASGTAMLMALTPYGSNGYESAPSVERDGVLYFTGCDGFTVVCSVYASDGSAAGTHSLFSIGHDATLSFAVVGTRLLVVTGSFNGDAGGEPWVGYRLYSYDLATQGEARLLLDVEPNGGPAVHMSALAMGTDRARFAVANCSNGDCTGALWNSDGSLAGTQPVPGLISWQPTARAFEAYDAEHSVFTCARADIGEELCETDGTAEGTRLVRDIFPGPGWSGITMRNVGGKLYFAADDAHHGLELWTLGGDAILADGFDTD